MDRDALAKALRQYLSEEITAFDLDDTVFDLWQTQDETVEHVADALWFHYDDCKDHKVVATKEEWDYFQRLLLLLDSDGNVVKKKTRKWSWRQLLAFAGLVAFCAAVAYLEGDERFLLLILSSWVLSVVLWYVRRRSAWDPARVTTTTHPFSSVAEVLRIRRRTPSFRKHRFPRHVAGRRIRSRFVVAALWLPVMAFWAVLSPIILLFQTLPDTELETRVVAP